MAGLMGGGNFAPPRPMPPAPDRSSEQVQQAAEEQRRRFSITAPGRGSTQGAGIPGPINASSVAASVLGGVGR